MADSRAKGSRGEDTVKKALRAFTKLNWERTPGSGNLDAKHGLKGDLYVPGEVNLYCVEVKSYADDHLTSEVLTHANPTLLNWYEQAVRQGLQTKKKPCLIFKFNRSKLFVAQSDFPDSVPNYIQINKNGLEFFVCLLEDWLTIQQPKFIS